MIEEEDDDEEYNQDEDYQRYQTETESSDNENDDHRGNPGSSRVFDTNIPTAHKYLGKLDNISGYTLYEDGQIIELPAVYTNTLAFPGFTLPLVLQCSDHDYQAGFNFVLIWLIQDQNMFFEYGVVMEVFERSIDENQVNIKARGRQRCKILPHQILLQPNRQLCKAKVKILEEGPITSPVSCTQLASLRQRFPYKGEYDAISRQRFQKYRAVHLGQFTFPAWVYDLYEVDYYVERIVNILAKYYAEENIPRDATALSFWFGQNFQLMNSERLTILRANTTLERLQLELQCLQLKRMLCCRHCDAQVADQAHVFAMSKDGLQSNYVNPGGVVYETVTLKKIRNFALEGTSKTEFSWFPGYAWTIVQCSMCLGHLGWMFTAANLRPRKFYGLARSCLTIITQEKAQTTDNETV